MLKSELLASGENCSRVLNQSPFQLIIRCSLEQGGNIGP
jgi:hypothetical protein